LTIQGSDTEYEVNLEDVTCTCPHFKFRLSRLSKADSNRLCKHLLPFKDNINVKVKSKGWSMKSKHKREDIQRTVNLLVAILNTYPLTKYEFVGSYRRGKDLIGDIDVIICCDIVEYEYLINEISEYAEKVLASGKLKTSFLYNSIQCDFRIVSTDSWWTMLLHSTGSAEENIRLRSKALRLGYSLNEYRLVDENGDEILLRSEQDIYEYLEEDYKEPKDR